MKKIWGILWIREMSVDSTLILQIPKIPKIIFQAVDLGVTRGRVRSATGRTQEKSVGEHCFTRE